MDFSAWSPSHTILALFAVVVFIGQVGVYFYRTKQNDKKLDKQGEDLRLALKEQGETFFHAIERLEDRMDKGFVEVNQQIVGVREELRGEISSVRDELRSEIQGVQGEISGVREELRGEIQGVQGEIANVREELRSEIQGVRGEIADVRTEMNQRLSDMTTEISKLNQNHIDHLTRHKS